MLNTIVNLLKQILGLIMSVLPDSPFNTAIKMIENVTWFKWLAWFIPIDKMVVVGELWLSAIAIYYVYMVLLRWAKALN